MKIAVLVTVHNRADVTVKGLTQLGKLSRELSEEFVFYIYLVDDGSTDGTSARVRELPLNISLTNGSGTLYWNRGMVLAYKAAQRQGAKFDAYMLYNDDIYLSEKFGDFLRHFREHNKDILVGAFLEPSTGDISYSGYLRTSKLRPTSFAKPGLTGLRVPIDTFNGNLVLVPAAVFERLDGLDPKFTHAYGDIDLGLRAKDLGVNSFIFGIPVGLCDRGPHLDQRIRSSTLRNRVQLLFGFPHGPASHLRFVKKHGVTVLFPVYVVADLVKRIRKLFWTRTG